ncbi:MAG: SCO family protein, partial [Candidatus Rokubacteria bacterium]|nr:SCO family protein [Candidatus Rokubacteria bacterium]
MRAAAVGLALAAAVGLALAAAPAGPAGAHSVPGLDDVFVQGLFTPTFTPPPPGTYELPVIRSVGGFTLLDTEGRRVNTRALTRGKVAVVSFIYTGCADGLGCPLASAALRELQRRVQAEALERAAVLLSVSFDPAHDRPAALAKYARLFEADPAL